MTRRLGDQVTHPSDTPTDTLRLAAEAAAAAAAHLTHILSPLGQSPQGTKKVLAVHKHPIFFYLFFPIFSEFSPPAP